LEVRRLEGFGGPPSSEFVTESSGVDPAGANGALGKKRMLPPPTWSSVNLLIKPPRRIIDSARARGVAAEIGRHDGGRLPTADALADKALSLLDRKRGRFNSVVFAGEVKPIIRL